MANTPPSLSTILSDDLLHSIAPYLHPRDISALSLTSARIYSQLSSTPSIHRYTDLESPPPGNHKSTSEFDDVHRFLRSPALLSATRTLVLDYSPVPFPILESVLISAPSIVILSLRSCTGFSDHELIAYLRTPQTPKPKGIYLFSDPSAPAKTSRFVAKWRGRRSAEWATVVSVLIGIVTFDTRLCRGDKSSDMPHLADIALGGGCAGCGIVTPSVLRDGPPLPSVLLGPAPLHSSSIKAACKGPGGRPLADCLRCEECVRGQWCNGCGVWWCDACAVGNKHVTRTCFECDFQCSTCNAAASRVCNACRGGYCISHNEGADDVHCEWCKSSPPHCTITSNGFLTRAASAYYTGVVQSRPGNTYVGVKGRALTSRSSRAGVQGRGGVGGVGGSGSRIVGRHFQNEVLVRRRGLMNN